LPDGTLLIVSADDRRVVRLVDGELVEHADLSGLASFGCNDMVVDASGRAWVGASDNAGIPRPAESELLVVDPDGSARVVDERMAFPNGSVVTPDQTTLVVAETFGSRLTAFTLDGAGGASDRRVWAALDRGSPDGIALDAEGAIWYADPGRNECVRVREGGEVLERVATPDPCFACALGGPDGTTLFLLTSGSTDHVRNLAERPGRIATTEVDVPAA
jgi:sugar lactone lactonase YvrE